jgi:peptidoglycan/LPS O-acetylase OafA/YrhL
MEYRREIDGLRALAVIPVMLFHAGFELFSGGFIGVDVFFVISGYLITSIILADLEAGTFSIAGFYERRARRILPALFLVLGTCIPLAWFLLLPGHMKGFSQGLIAVPLFASNVLFWRQSGYFDTAAELNPLLHTWSLAVEEQFYLLFPLLLMLALKVGGRRRWTAMWLMIAAVLSISIAEWGSLHRPAATFFLLPTRAWELAIGSLVAFYLAHDERRLFAPFANDLLGLIGFGLILFSVFSYRSTTPFPGLYALAPTVGTALVIVFASHRTYAGRVLGSKALVGLGLVSYSAYLWHQPLLAFARHKSAEDLKWPALMAMVVATFVLAFVTWKLVEQPFRDRRRFDRRAIFGAAALCSTLFVAVGALGVATNGAEQRFSVHERHLIAMTDYKNAMVAFQLRKCFIDYDQNYDVLLANDCFSEVSTKRRVVVFGDSEAAHLAHGLRSVFPESLYRVDQWTATSCRPVAFPDQTERCRKFVTYFVDTILPKLREQDLLVIAGNWGLTERGMGHTQFVERIEKAFGRFGTSRAKIIVFGNAPDFTKHPIEQILKRNAAGERQVYQHAIDYSATDARVSGLTKQHGFIYFDPSSQLCNGSSDCLVYDNGEPIFSDANHLSAKGSRFIAEKLVQQLRNVVALEVPFGTNHP